MKILVVVAMTKEADPIIKKLDMCLSNIQLPENLRAPVYFKLYDQHEVYLVLSGKDKVHNTDLLGSGIIPSVTLAIHIIKPSLIINIGSAGGFSQRGAKKHEIYLSDGEFRFHDRLFGPDVYHTPYGVGSYPVFDGVDELANKLNLKRARVSTGGSMLSSREEEEQMKKNGAVLKEMEAAHVAQVATLFNVPVLAIKGVSDLVDITDCPQQQFADSIHSLSEKLAEVLCNVLKALPQKNRLQYDSIEEKHNFFRARL